MSSKLELPDKWSRGEIEDIVKGYIKENLTTTLVLTQSENKKWNVRYLKAELVLYLEGEAFMVSETEVQLN